MFTMLYDRLKEGVNKINYTKKILRIFERQIRVFYVEIKKLTDFIFEEKSFLPHIEFFINSNWKDMLFDIEDLFTKEEFDELLSFIITLESIQYNYNEYGKNKEEKYLFQVIWMLGYRQGKDGKIVESDETLFSRYNYIKEIIVNILEKQGMLQND